MNVKLKYEINAPYKENLIRARGIEDVDGFLMPSPSNLQDPRALGAAEMQLAKEWIDEYIQRVQSKRKRKPSGKLIREVLNDFSVGLNSGGMTREEVKNYIEHMDKNELVKLCEDIYQWRYETGKLKPDCALNKLAECLQYWEIKDIEEIVIEVATKRFNEVVLLLFKSNPNNYLK